MEGWKIAELIPGLGNLFSSQSLQRFGALGPQVFLWFVIVIIVAGLGWLIINHMLYNINVMIYVRRGGNTLAVAKDRARIVKEKGVRKLRFKSGQRKNLRLPAPSPEFLYNTLGWGMFSPGPVLFLYKYGQTEHVPVATDKKGLIVRFMNILKKKEPENKDVTTIEELYRVTRNFEVVENADDLGITPIPEHIDAWEQMENANIIDEYLKPNPMVQFGPHIMFAFVIIASLVLMWMSWGKADIIAKALENAATTIAGAR